MEGPTPSGGVSEEDHRHRGFRGVRAEKTARLTRGCRVHAARPLQSMSFRQLPSGSSWLPPQVLHVGATRGEAMGASSPASNCLEALGEGRSLLASCGSLFDARRSLFALPEPRTVFAVASAV